MQIDTKTFPAKNFIDNEWTSNPSAEVLEVKNKYTTEVLAKVEMAGETDMELAIEAAGLAFEKFSTWSAAKRADHLTKLATLIDEHRDYLEFLIVREAGKPASYAAGELDRCLSTVRLAAAEALTFSGESVALDFDAGEGMQAFTRRFPIGVIGCITPFNFPLNLVLHKVAPALATGNTVVLKPALQTPLTALALAKLIEKAGYPKGVFNALVCKNDVSEELVRSERVAMISFTGSDKVGWKLKEICGKKKITLELGGNAAVLIDKSANLDGLADKLAYAACLYAGQICIATQRIFVHQDIFEHFKSELTEAMGSLDTGDPANENTISGPVISADHLDRIHQWVRVAEEQGATILCGAEIISKAHCLYAPTLLTNTQDSMKVWSEEIFGPVAIIEQVADFEAGLEAVNNSRYGLQVGVYTSQIDHLKAAHDKLEVGGIMINNVPGFRVDSMPYGGVKDSGLGREGVRYAMEDMTEPRLLVY